MYDFHRIAQTIERGGMAAAEDAVSAIVKRGRQLGAPRILTDVAATRSEPDVARARALARLVGWMENGSDAGVDTPLAG